MLMLYFVPPSLKGLTPFLPIPNAAASASVKFWELSVNSYVFTLARVPGVVNGPEQKYIDSEWTVV